MTAERTWGAGGSGHGGRGVLDSALQERLFARVHDRLDEGTDPFEDPVVRDLLMRCPEQAEAVLSLCVLTGELAHASPADGGSRPASVVRRRSWRRRIAAAALVLVSLAAAVTAVRLAGTDRAATRDTAPGRVAIGTRPDEAEVVHLEIRRGPVGRRTGTFVRADVQRRVFVSKNGVRVVRELHEHRRVAAGAATEE